MKTKSLSLGRILFHRKTAVSCLISPFSLMEDTWLLSVAGSFLGGCWFLRIGILCPAQYRLPWCTQSHSTLKVSVATISAMGWYSSTHTLYSSSFKGTLAGIPLDHASLPLWILSHRYVLWFPLKPYRLHF